MRGSFCPAFFSAICRKTLSLRLASSESISFFEGADGETPGFSMERDFAFSQDRKQQKKGESSPCAISESAVIYLVRIT